MKKHTIENWSIDYHPSFKIEPCKVWVFSTGIEDQRKEGVEGSTGCHEISASDWESLFGKLSVYLFKKDIEHSDELDRMLLGYYLKK